MTRWERKAALVAKRVKITDIARRLGVSQSHVSAVVAEKRRSPRVEREIAFAIGLPVAEVFGDPQKSAA